MPAITPVLTKSDNLWKKLRGFYRLGFRVRLGGLVLLGLGAWLLLRLWDGTLSFYLHPRFNLLIAFSGLGLVFLGGWLLLWHKAEKLEKTHGGVVEFSGMLLVGLVALAGLVLPPRPLDNNRLNVSSSKSGVAVSGGNSNRALAQALLNQDWKDTNKLDTVRWNLLDWSAVLNDPKRADSLIGRPADVIGFVIQAKAESTRYFLLARYVVVCCTADSTVLKIPVISDTAQAVEEGQWVRVRGTLGKGANENIAFLASTVESIARPSQPYIFP